MVQLIFASFSHTHYRYEVGMLKVPAVYILSISRLATSEWVALQLLIVLFTRVVYTLRHQGDLLLVYHISVGSIRNLLRKKKKEKKRFGRYLENLVTSFLAVQSNGNMIPGLGFWNTMYII